MYVTTTHNISGQRIADLMITAIEGGSNYWCKRIELVGCANGYRPVEKPWYADPGLYDQTTFTILVVEDEPNTEGSSGEFRIWADDIAAGFMLMAEKYPGHWKDFISENEDATTADVWLQCVCFGCIVYG